MKNIYIQKNSHCNSCCRTAAIAAEVSSSEIACRNKKIVEQVNKNLYSFSKKGEESTISYLINIKKHQVVIVVNIPIIVSKVLLFVFYF